MSDSSGDQPNLKRRNFLKGMGGLAASSMLPLPLRAVIPESAALPAAITAAPAIAAPLVESFELLTCCNALGSMVINRNKFFYDHQAVRAYLTGTPSAYGVRSYAFNYGTGAELSELRESVELTQRWLSILRENLITLQQEHAVTPQQVLQHWLKENQSGWRGSMPALQTYFPGERAEDVPNLLQRMMGQTPETLQAEYAPKIANLEKLHGQVLERLGGFDHELREGARLRAEHKARVSNAKPSYPDMAAARKVRGPIPTKCIGNPESYVGQHAHSGERHRLQFPQHDGCIADKSREPKR